MTPSQAIHSARAHGLALDYRLDVTQLTPAAKKVVELSVDADLARYIAESEQHRHGRLKTWIHRRLRSVFSDFDINGLLGTYPMHVLSAAQWEELLSGRPGGTLLDIGAGRGDVTAHLAQLFDHVTASETSRGMARRLARQGYEVLKGDLATHPVSGPYDAVSLLNVLDRCDRPLSLLAAARGALRENGLLLIALVLPYRPFVYDQGASRAPRERLPITSDTFERAASEFIDLCLLALGLEVLAVSRVPYLSGGDAEAPLYELDDLIVVCRSLGPAPPILGQSRSGRG